MAEARTAADELLRFVAAAFESQGVPKADAAKAAGLMVDADLFGYDTHGVFRRRQYVNRLCGGSINPRAHASAVVLEQPSRREALQVMRTRRVTCPLLSQ